MIVYRNRNTRDIAYFDSANPRFSTDRGWDVVDSSLAPVDASDQLLRRAGESRVVTASERVRHPAPVINAAAYGAAGDGVTVDTDRIQACLDAAPEGSRIYLPEGTFIITTTGGYGLKLTKKNLELFGSGRDSTIIKLRSGNGDYSALISDGTANGATDLSGLYIHDLTIDQNSDGNPMSDVTMGGPLYHGSPRAAVRVNHAFDVRIEDVRFANSDCLNTIQDSGGASLTGRWVVARCYFTGVGNGAQHDHSTIYFHGDDIEVAANIFEAGGAAAITAIETHGAKQMINGNRVYGYCTMANVTGTAGTAQNAIVTNNIGRAVGMGIHMWAYDFTGLVGAALSDVVISQNQVEIDWDAWHAAMPTAYRFGISLNAGSTAVAQRVRIIGNQIRYLPFVGTPTSTDNQSAGILWYRAATVTAGTEETDLEISNNTVEGSLSAGIYYAPNILAKRVRINENVITNPGSGSPNAAYHVGVFVASTAGINDIEISRNDVLDSRGTHAVTSAVDTQFVTSIVNGRGYDNTVRCADGTNLKVHAGHASAAWYTKHSMPVHVTPTGAWAAGSIVDETTTGSRFRQTAPPAGSTWAEDTGPGTPGGEPIATAHAAATDPHSDRSFATAAIATHSGATDPHQDRSFTTTAITTHSGATDPHGDQAFATAGLALKVSKGSQTFDAQDYSLVANGSTDDTAHIQAAIAAAAAAGGGVVLLPAKSMSLGSATLTIPSNVHLRGQGMGKTILLQNYWPNLASTDVNGPSLIEATGSLGTPLTASAVGPVVSVITGISATGGLSVGQLLVLASTDAYWSGFSTRYKGEIVRVKSIDSASQITIYGITRDDYTAGVTLTPMTMVTNVGMSDLTIRNTDPGTSKATAWCGSASAATCLVERVELIGCGLRRGAGHQLLRRGHARLLHDATSPTTQGSSNWATGCSLSWPRRTSSWTSADPPGAPRVHHGRVGRLRRRPPQHGHQSTTSPPNAPRRRSTRTRSGAGSCSPATTRSAARTPAIPAAAMTRSSSATPPATARPASWCGASRAVSATERRSAATVFRQMLGRLRGARLRRRLGDRRRQHHRCTSSAGIFVNDDATRLTHHRQPDLQHRCGRRVSPGRHRDGDRHNRHRVAHREQHLLQRCRDHRGGPLSRPDDLRHPQPVRWADRVVLRQQHRSRHGVRDDLRRGREPGPQQRPA